MICNITCPVRAESVAERSANGSSWAAALGADRQVGQVAHIWTW